MRSLRSTSRRRATVGAIAALALIVGACGGDDDTTDSTDTDGSVAIDGGGDQPDDTTADTVEVVQGGGTLAAVKARGELVCGANDTLPGFGSVNEAGEFEGFDIDFCKVVAAAVLGDANAVRYVPLTAQTRFTALQSGEVDVLIRNTTWTATRDGQESMTFLHTTFFDGQGLMVPADTGYTTLEDLDEANICVTPGTTTELNLSAVFQSRGLAYNPVVIETDAELRQLYEAGQCEVWTTDISGLTAWKFTIEDEGGAEQFILPEVISKEPLGPGVRDGDSEWAQVVDWAVLATIQAWEYGIDSTNVDGYTTDDVGIQNFLGQNAGDFDPGLGLDPDFAVNIISQVGNYEEIFKRNVEPLGLVMEGSPNNLWTNGGLLYAPPYR
ncbi:MAG TPA: amino acid ABC transporter substrate-binding protein [Ilumatobacter sp.]|nr:amino acid ABC transporter substrate-binding protein [Ilumatobacter sp.]